MTVHGNLLGDPFRAIPKPEHVIDGHRRRGAVRDGVDDRDVTDRRDGLLLLEHP